MGLPSAGVMIPSCKTVATHPAIPETKLLNVWIYLLIKGKTDNCFWKDKPAVEYDFFIFYSEVIWKQKRLVRIQLRIMQPALHTIDTDN